jgi:hypothetical protein
VWWLGVKSGGNVAHEMHVQVRSGSHTVRQVPTVARRSRGTQETVRPLEMLGSVRSCTLLCLFADR